MKKQMAFYFDSSGCSGCKTCQMACKDRNNLEIGTLWRRIYEISGGNWSRSRMGWIPNIIAYHLSIACNHCASPVCRDVCPTGAISKRKDGIVLIDQQKCMGCRYCEWACPYGAPQYDRTTGKMSKCNLCYDAVDKGDTPACVSACPGRVLDFGEKSLLEKKYSGSALIYPLPDPEMTDPSILIHPHATSIRAGRGKAHIINREEV